MALTDHGTVSEWANLHKYAHPAGILPIFGVEAYMVEDRRLFAKQERRHLILLAITPEGYRNLVRLVTISAMFFYRKPCLDLDALARHSAGIVALTACLGGFVARKFFTGGDEREGDGAAAEREYGRLHDIFGDRLYLEVQPYAAAPQRQFNEWAFDKHDRDGTPLAATNDVHYLDRDDAAFHPYVVMAGMGAWQRRGSDGYNDGVEKYVAKPGGNHYRSRAEMVEAFQALHGDGILRRDALWAAMAAPMEVYGRASGVRFDASLKIPVLPQSKSNVLENGSSAPVSVV